VNSGSVPAKSKPASSRTALRPPSLLPARRGDHGLPVVGHGCDGSAPDDLHAEVGRPPGQHPRNRVEAGHEPFHRRAGQPEREGGRVDVSRVEAHAREMADTTGVRRVDRVRVGTDLLLIGA
jgi:hypothetical protein